MNRTAANAKDPAPISAWRVPTVWLVVGGPAAVVVASIATAVVAWRGADPVLDTRVQAGSQAEGQAPGALPALQARNHAATGGRP